MIGLDDRKKLLKLARFSISSFFAKEDINVEPYIKDKFGHKAGAFVTLKQNGELRGCIGYTEAVMPLYDAIVQAARAAAFSDPRFKQLQKEELEKIKIEISVLTNPELIEVKESNEYFDKIKIGRDGLIIESVYGKGLLLPQVPVEWKWNAEDFLMNTCKKAGLPEDAWKDLTNKIYSFQAEIFSE